MRNEVQDNAALHGYSIAGMAVLLVALTGFGYFGTDLLQGGGPSPPKGPDLSKLKAIEASVAYRKAKPQQQPQKQKKAPDPVKKADGVSRDETKTPVTKPDEETDKKAGEKPTLDDFKRVNTDDLEEGKVVDPSNDFNEERFGFAEETKGDPYVQDLLSDLVEAGGEYPTLASSEGYPIGCFHMNAEGKILDTILREKAQPENPELDDFAERALNGLKKKRNKDPQPIPDRQELLPLMTEWTCFAFKL